MKRINQETLKFNKQKEVFLYYKDNLRFDFCMIGGKKLKRQRNTLKENQKQKMEIILRSIQ